MSDSKGTSCCTHYIYIRNVCLKGTTVLDDKSSNPHIITAYFFLIALAVVSLA